MNKILVIDDEIKICELIQKIFHKRNFEVIYSLNGKDGLALFYIVKPDIVILDLCLGDTSGLEILKIIKKHKPLCFVVMITASRLRDNEKRALELGADYYIHKPFNIEELKNTVLNLY